MVPVARSSRAWPRMLVPLALLLAAPAALAQEEDPAPTKPVGELRGILADRLHVPVSALRPEHGVYRTLDNRDEYLFYTDGRGAYRVDGATGRSRFEPAQRGTLTPRQAMKLLRPHLQPPATAFGDEFEVRGWHDRHPEYVFRGSGQDDYRIDAVSGDLDVRPDGKSTLEAGVQPAVTLPAARLRQIAIDYVAAHFPAYTPDLFEVSAFNIHPEDDCNEYDVVFRRHARSGAELPMRCWVRVEEDTGCVVSYEECATRTVVSTEPAVTEEQAIAIGRAWIAANITARESGLEFVGPRDQYPIKFEVRVDPLMNQALVHEIPFRATCVIVDARAGVVIGIDQWSCSEDGPRPANVKRLVPKETLWEVRAGGSLGRSAVEAGGRVYLWAGYAKAVGLQVKRSKDAVTVAGDGKQAARLTTTSKRPTTSAPVAWLRGGELYLPVAALRRLTDRLTVEVSARRMTVRAAWAAP